MLCLKISAVEPTKLANRKASPSAQHLFGAHRRVIPSEALFSGVEGPAFVFRPVSAADAGVAPVSRPAVVRASRPHSYASHFQFTRYDRFCPPRISPPRISSIIRKSSPLSAARSSSSGRFFSVFLSCCPRRHRLISAWSPFISTSGARTPPNSAGRVYCG